MVRALRMVMLTVIVALAATGVVWAQSADDPGFVAGTEDVPLMPGLREVADAGMIFDTPSGRIVEAFASGITTPQQVLAFYTATLPQLGWEAAGRGTFRREGEVLVLEFPQGGFAGTPAEELVVRFALSPADAPGARRP